MVNKDSDEIEKLRKTLSELGLSNNALARLVGVHERTVRLWLSDEETTPIPKYAWIILDQYKRIIELERRLDVIQVISSAK